MWQAIVDNIEFRYDDEIIDAFTKKRVKEFEDRMIKAYGSYDPDMHYDFNKRKHLTNHNI